MLSVGDTRVLVVDDEANITDLVATALRYEGFDVEVAATGTDALRAAETFRPDLMVLDIMLPYYVEFQVFQMILDARASEHSARMVAMKNATDNSVQFIKDLTLEYNKMRQASITTELLEIATAQMALGG